VFKEYNELQGVLHRAWEMPFTTKSDYAREHADVIAMAASRGLLTTEVACGIFSREWRVTVAGVRLLSEMNGVPR